MLALVEGMAAACRAAGVALIGGETAQMPDTYSSRCLRRGRHDDRDRRAFGHARSGAGAGRRPHRGRALGRAAHQRLQPRSQDGRVAGPRPPGGRGHARGCAAGATSLVLPGAGGGLRRPGARVVAHITGGGLEENLPRVLPDGRGCHLRCRAWTVPPVFAVIARDQDVDRAARDVPRLQHGHRPGHRRRERGCRGPAAALPGSFRAGEIVERAEPRVVLAGI